MNRAVGEGGVASVEMPDARFDLLAQHLVFGHALARRNRNEDEFQSVALARVLEEMLDRREALKDALGVIQPLDRKDDLLVIKVFAELLDLILYARGTQLGVELARVDADRIDPQSRGVALNFRFTP